MDLIKQTIEFATKAHLGQLDKAGVDYITHPMRVSSKLKGKAKIVALLHDVVEDTKYTIQDIKDKLTDDKEIIQALILLTKTKKIPYDKYLAKIKKNKIALQVKLEDIKDNSDVKRLNKLSPKLRDKLTIKYSEAKSMLEQTDKISFNEYVEFKETIDYILDKSNISFDVLDEALKIAQKNPKQPWLNIEIPKSASGDTIEKAEKRLEKQYKEEILPLVNKSKKEFLSILKKNTPARGRFFTNVKKLKSLKSKVIDRKKYGSGRVHDILRATILTKDTDDLNSVVNKFKRNVKLHSYKNKKFGADKTYGYYGTHHFDIILKSGMMAEVIIATKKLGRDKEIAHNIYDELRGSNKKLTDKEKKDIMAKSKLIKIKDDLSDKDKEKMLRKSKAIFRRGNYGKK